MSARRPGTCPGWGVGGGPGVVPVTRRPGDWRARECGRPGARLGSGLLRTLGTAGLREVCAGPGVPAPDAPGGRGEWEWPGASVSLRPPMEGMSLLARTWTLRRENQRGRTSRLSKAFGDEDLVASRLGLLRVLIEKGKVSSNGNNCSKRDLQMIVGRCGARKKYCLCSFKEDHTSKQSSEVQQFRVISTWSSIV